VWGFHPDGLLRKIRDVLDRPRPPLTDAEARPPDPS